MRRRSERSSAIGTMLDGPRVGGAGPDCARRPVGVRLEEGKNHGTFWRKVSRTGRPYKVYCDRRPSEDRAQLARLRLQYERALAGQRKLMLEYERKEKRNERNQQRAAAEVDRLQRLLKTRTKEAFAEARTVSELKESIRNALVIRDRKLAEEQENAYVMDQYAAREFYLTSEEGKRAFVHLFVQSSSVLHGVGRLDRLSDGTDLTTVAGGGFTPAQILSLFLTPNRLPLIFLNLPRQSASSNFVTVAHNQQQQRGLVAAVAALNDGCHLQWRQGATLHSRTLPNGTQVPVVTEACHTATRFCGTVMKMVQGREGYDVEVAMYQLARQRGLIQRQLVPAMRDFWWCGQKGHVVLDRLDHNAHTLGYMQYRSWLNVSTDDFKAANPNVTMAMLFTSEQLAQMWALASMMDAVGLVHGDLKLANLLYRVRDRRFMVHDFEVSSFVTEPRLRNPTTGAPIPPRSGWHSMFGIASFTPIPPDLHPFFNRWQLLTELMMANQTLVAHTQARVPNAITHVGLFAGFRRRREGDEKHAVPVRFTDEQDQAIRDFLPFYPDFAGFDEGNRDHQPWAVSRTRFMTFQAARNAFALHSGLQPVYVDLP